MNNEEIFDLIFEAANNVSVRHGDGIKSREEFNDIMPGGEELVIFMELMTEMISLAQALVPQRQREGT